MMRWFGFAALAAGLMGGQAQAGSYIVCDNGLDCVTEPCPSRNLLDVGTGKVSAGIWVDLTRLSAAERNEAQQTEATYYGRLVFEGVVEQRTIGTASLPHLTPTKIERPSTAAEQQRCRKPV
jgi:hypothetical protein